MSIKFFVLVFCFVATQTPNTTELRDPIEHPLDAVSILVGSEVVDGRGFSVWLRRDDRPDPLEWAATSSSKWGSCMQPVAAAPLIFSPLKSG